MNTEEIFKRYTEAGNKSRAVKEMADEYGVAGSDIVCELFKTGYKFEELKRASVTQYKSAQKKYQQWKNNGSQPDQEEDVMEKYKNEEGEFTVNSPEDMVQLLSADNEKLIKENEELKKIKGELEKRINSLKVSDFNSTVDSMQSDLKVEKLTEENEQLRRECEENKRMKREFDEMTQNYNDAMRINAALEEKIKILESDAETEDKTIREMHLENEELKIRLHQAEAFILDKVVYSLYHVPVVHGKWLPQFVSTRDLTNIFSCSNCNVSVRLLHKKVKCSYKYCPYCGAKMEE